jgi:hypothetical protein
VFVEAMLGLGGQKQILPPYWFIRPLMVKEKFQRLSII